MTKRNPNKQQINVMILFAAIIFSILFTSQFAFSFNITDLNPQHYYQFDTGSTITIDDMGLIDGILENGAGWASGGIRGGSLKLDGRDDFIRIPYDPILDLSTEGTIRAWVNYDVIDDYDGIISKGVASDWSDETYNFQFMDNGHLAGILNGNSGTYDIVKTNYSLNSNTWYYVLFRWNSTDLDLFVDGEHAAHAVNTVGPARVNPSDVLIGCQVDGAYCPKGKIDEVVIWNRHLNKFEIKADYQYSYGTYSPVCGNGIVDDV